MPASTSITGVVINVIEPRPRETHPCLKGQHRPAWLVDGGVACGVCGVYL